MAIDFPISTLLTGLPENSLWHLEISAQWGSLQPQSREHMQTAIDAAQTEFGKPFHYSLSHCRSAGGFASIHHSDLQVGFDIEETARAAADTVARISTPKEMELAPSPAALWCAKESLFKSLRGPSQPRVTSAIIVDHWIQSKSSGFWEFKSSTHHNQGRVASYDLWTYAIAWHSTTEEA